MRLLYQLGLVSLTLLLVPWAGCEFLAENERALQAAQQRAAAATAQTIATTLAQQPELLYPAPVTTSTLPPPGLLVHPLPSPPLLDGWLDEWTEIPVRSFGNRRRMDLQLGRHGDKLYLAATITEPEPRYLNPQRGDVLHHDQLQLYPGKLSGAFLTLAPEAPGGVSLQMRDLTGAALGVSEWGQAWWLETADGYQIEIALDMEPLAGQLGVVYLGIDNAGIEQLGLVVDDNNALATRLIMPAPLLDQWLGRIAPLDAEVSVYDRWQWPLAAAGQRLTSSDPDSFWLLRWIYRRILPTVDVAGALATDSTGRVTTPLLQQSEGIVRRIIDLQQPTLLVTAPILTKGETIGVVAVSQSSERFLSLTDAAFGRLLERGLLMLFITVSALVGFATVTSWRIRKLTISLARPIDRSGEPPIIPVGFIGDEIDQLAAQINSQLDQLAEYQRYLGSLNQTLAHELRTPVAIVASSLDNLQMANSASGEQAELVGRAREGITRLQQVFTSLQEARQLEQAIAVEHRECVDLVALLRALIAAYAQTHASHHFVLHAAFDAAPADIVPEQIVQALDKLVENAVSFAQSGSEIRVLLEARGLWWRLAVANDGPLLPATVREIALFEPLITARTAESRQQHMGLGLHIVRLIARNHGGEPFAQNASDSSGVIIGFSLRAGAS